MPHTERRRIAGSKHRWSVNLAACESAIREQDEYVFTKSPRFVDLVAKYAEKQVQKNEATESLETLTDAGCARRKLLYLVGMCENRGITNAFQMTGYESEELKHKLRSLREAASIARRLNGHDSGQHMTEFGKYLDMAEESKSGPGIFLDLPNSISEYASLVEHSVKHLGGKADFYLSLAKALLDEFIGQHTGGHHDYDVARMLSVMLGPEYGEVQHRVWRSAYKKRLNNFCPEASDSPSLRVKKTVVECEAAVYYRMDVLHTGVKYLRQEGRTALRHSDLA